MESNANTGYPPYGQASGPPSAPPGDHYYPALPQESQGYQDAPPPYSSAALSATHDSPYKPPHSSHPTPQRQGSGRSQTGAVSSRPAGTPNGNPNIMASTNSQQPVQVIVQGDLGAAVPPGVCDICRRGKIKDSATCCSWVACFFLLPFGIIPGLIAFCYACRKPKCTRCGYVHGKKK